MELASAQRKYASLHAKSPYHDGTFTSWGKDRSDSHPYHYDDGVRLWVSDVDFDPDGTWLSGASINPDESGEEVTHGDQE